jgi:hypothetical protein
MKKKSQLQRPGLKLVARPCTKKRTAKAVDAKNSILSIEIMKSCLEYIMCNFDLNKGPHEVKTWEKN